MLSSWVCAGAILWTTEEIALTLSVLFHFLLPGIHGSCLERAVTLWSIYAMHYIFISSICSSSPFHAARL